MYQAVIYCIFGLLLFLYFTLSYKYKHWNRLGIPSLKPTFLFGHEQFGRIFSKSYYKCVDAVYLEARARGLPFCGYFQFTSPLLMVLDPSLIENILVKDYAYFINHNSYKFDADHLFSNQLFSMNDDYWKHLRRQLSSLFSATRMKVIVEGMNKCRESVDHFVNKNCDNGSTVDVKELAKNFCVDVIGTTMNADFSYFHDRKTEIIEAIVKALRPSLFGFFATYVYMFYPNFGFHFSLMTAKETLVFKSFISDNIKNRLKSNLQNNDVFQFLLGVKNDHETGSLKSNNPEKCAKRDKEGSKDSARISSSPFEENPQEEKDIEHEINIRSLTEANPQMIGHVFWTLTDAIETSSVPLSFCFHLLSLHPECQRKIKEEVEEALSKYSTSSFTYEVMQELKYTDQVVKETLRFYPAFIPILRLCNKDYRVPNTTTVIPKGTVIVISSHSLHQDPEYFSDPLEFRPERFNEENAGKIKPFTFLPFGNGPRSCIGARYAVAKIKFSIASIVLNFEMKPLSTKSNLVELHPLSPIFLKPKKPILIQFVRRQNK